MPSSSDEFELPRLIICEGPKDIAFFQKLIEVRTLPRFHIRPSGADRREHGGNTKFRQALRAARINRGFGRLRHILIVSDNDQDPDQSLQSIVDQITEAGLRAPTAELQPADNNSATTNFSLMIMMLPLGKQRGNLESVCLAAARHAEANIAAHVDKFIEIVKRDSWTKHREEKAWLRTDLAARSSDPFIPLGKVFQGQFDENLIPLDHKSFDPIADILANFA